MNGASIEKLYDMMKTYTEAKGVLLSLYYNGNSDIIRVAANDTTTYVTYNTYYTESDINELDYLSFEKLQDFADRQERLRRADVRANVGIREEEEEIVSEGEEQES